MLQDLTQGEILSAARRREAVEYLMERYEVSERRACRLVGQHRSTQRYGGGDREEQDATNGTTADFRDPDTGHRRAHLGGTEPGRGWQGGVTDRERPWRVGEDPRSEDGGLAGHGNGNGYGNGNDRRYDGSHDDGRPLASVRKLPFVDDRVPCLARVRTSLMHDLVWLTRDSDIARLLGANVLFARLGALAAAPQGLVHKVRGHGERSSSESR